MNAIVSASFWKLYHSLPRAARIQARKAFRLWTRNPRHPSLRFKLLAGEDGYCSVRINDKYRVVGILRGDTVRWTWIGSHNDFDRLF